MLTVGEREAASDGGNRIRVFFCRSQFYCGNFPDSCGGVLCLGCHAQTAALSRAGPGTALLWHPPDQRRVCLARFAESRFSTAEVRGARVSVLCAGVLAVLVSAVRDGDGTPAAAQSDPGPRQRAGNGLVLDPLFSAPCGSDAFEHQGRTPFDPI